MKMCLRCESFSFHTPQRSGLTSQYSPCTTRRKEPTLLSAQSQSSSTSPSTYMLRSTPMRFCRASRRSLPLHIQISLKPKWRCVSLVLKVALLIHSGKHSRQPNTHSGKCMLARPLCSRPNHPPNSKLCRPGPNYSLLSDTLFAASCAADPSKLG